MSELDEAVSKAFAAVDESADGVARVKDLVAPDCPACARKACVQVCRIAHPDGLYLHARHDDDRGITTCFERPSA